MEKFQKTKFVKFILKMSWIQFILLWTLAIPFVASVAMFMIPFLISQSSFYALFIFAFWFINIISVVYGLLWLVALIIRFLVVLKDNTPKQS